MRRTKPLFREALASVLRTLCLTFTSHLAYRRTYRSKLTAALILTLVPFRLALEHCIAKGVAFSVLDKTHATLLVVHRKEGYICNRCAIKSMRPGLQEAL